MAAEIRSILTEAVREPDTSRGLLATVLDRFGEVGGVELDLAARSTPARAADLRSGRHTLATRSTRDFEDTDVDLVDPWDAA